MCASTPMTYATTWFRFLSQKSMLGNRRVIWEERSGSQSRDGQRGLLSSRQANVSAFVQVRTIEPASGMSDLASNADTPTVRGSITYPSALHPIISSTARPHA